MTTFAANLSILFPSLPFLDRFDAAADHGFEAVEFWWPGEALAAGLTVNDIVDRAGNRRLGVVLINFDAGDMKAGDRGLAGDPDRMARFRANVPVAIDLARRLGCRKLNALAGNVVDSADPQVQLELLAESIAFAADEAARDDMLILLEALNRAETPRYLLPGTSAVLDMIARVDRPNVRFQLDAYHLAMAGEDVVAAIRCAGSAIGHVQFADWPGRHEPGTGRLPYAAILDALHVVGYTDPISLEFVPAEPGAPDFAFVNQLGGRLVAPSGINR